MLKYISCVVNLRQTFIDYALIFDRINTYITPAQDALLFDISTPQNIKSLKNFTVLEKYFAFEGLHGGLSTF